MTLLDDFKRFVVDAESGSQYAKWAHDNPGELGRWQAFRDLILAGARPALPVMTTAHGRELVDAGVVYLDATVPPAVALKVAVTGTARQGSTLTARIVAA
jgi:hypothetical protein